MKINLYILHLIKIIASVITARKKPGAIFSYKFFVCCNNRQLTTGTNHIYVNDAKQYNASFFLPAGPLPEGGFVPATNIINKNFTRTKAVGICSFITMMLLANLVFTQFTYAVVTGPGAAWQSCRRATLSPVTPSADFQVKVTLAAGQYTNMNATGNDLRFYDINNNVCSYWIETWNNTGVSTIWVKVVTAGASAVYMYYGNAAAPATSNGANVFDFFDDFTTPLGATWTAIASTGTIIQSGTTVTLSLTNAGTVSLSNTAAFIPSSNSFFVETKHRETNYNRNRFYATNGSGAGNPLGFDNGYFNAGAGAQFTAQVFWNGAFGATVTRNTDYLSQWQITDGSTYTWKTFTYPAMGVVQTNTATYTTPDIRFITISVTEVAGTSTAVDWVRLRKFTATEPVATMGNQVNNVSATITGQGNVLCNGKATGTATVTATGGGTPYTYSWNSAPVQTTQTATNLIAATYIATVTESTIGISATATVTITQPVPVIATANSSNINCFNASDGEIIVTGSSGISPYVFSINNGTVYQAGGTFSSLPPGTYKPRVKDINGCESRSVQ